MLRWEIINMLSKSLLALACGDSYGSYFEMMGLQGTTFDIEKLPNKPVEIKITDDTKMAIILLKHYRKYKSIKADILFKDYRHWALTDGKTDGIGWHTKQILVDKSKDKDSQGNGALMRNIPFGLELIKDGYSFDEAVDIMNKESAITHKNETIFITNRLALDLAINGIEVLEYPIYKGILSKLEYGDTAWVVHSLYIIIEALKKNLSFIDGFKYIVAQGSDTDTNCAIYGAIRGYKEDISKVVDINEFLPLAIIKFLEEQI